MLTIYYSARLLYLVFVDVYSGFKATISGHAKSTNVEFIILGFLGILGTTTGYYFKDAFTGFGSNYFNSAITFLPSSWSLINLEFIPDLIKLMPLLTSSIAMYLALVLGVQGFCAMIHIDSSKTYLESCK